MKKIKTAMLLSSRNPANVKTAKEKLRGSENFPLSPTLIKEVKK